MKSLFKEIIKSAFIFGVGGALLAAAAPLIAMGFGALGFSALAGATSYGAAAGILGWHAASAAWVGAYFGAFGAIAGALTPLASHVVGEKTETIVKETGPAIIVEMSPQQQAKLSNAVSRFSDKIKDERAASAMLER